jgi:hypothetical protein
MQKLDKKFKIIDHYDDYQRYLDPDKRSELSWFGYCSQSERTLYGFKGIDLLSSKFIL